MTRFMIPLALLAMLSLAAVSSDSQAALFRDQMNLASDSGWSVNANNGRSDHTIGYDYSADGIPEAPNSEVGDTATQGVKMEANIDDGNAGTSSYFSLYPNGGQNFTGNYQLRFDAWMNFATAGFGTTEFMGGGIGYDNVAADVAGGGVQAVSATDYGTSNGYRAFKPGFFIEDAAMTGTTHAAANAYYSDFLPSVASPAIQSQGSGVSGAPTFQWITWEFNVDGNDVSVLIEKPNGDRLEIVSFDKTDITDGSTGANTDGNISLFYSDWFSSVSNSQSLQFGLIDNVVVVPEPTSLALVGFAATMLGFRRRNG